ncbi:hypothetical protein AVEN_30007-1 [Araneus ventricosus]|uniref:Uncharacterized protein n=1 Tax=Araneus ventricosus TaxID=182803 RepID=A0A4Y2NFQ5_ARAVE|nr:hypothetical protein AVEN_30007-1 [Araneus ventricosus]
MLADRWYGGIPSRTCVLAASHRHCSLRRAVFAARLHCGFLQIVAQSAHLSIFFCAESEYASRTTQDERGAPRANVLRCTYSAVMSAGGGTSNIMIWHALGRCTLCIQQCHDFGCG